MRHLDDMILSLFLSMIFGECKPEAQTIEGFFER
jgi:hypothetical protein